MIQTAESQNKFKAQGYYLYIYLMLEQQRKKSFISICKSK